MIDKRQLRHGNLIALNLVNGTTIAIVDQIKNRGIVWEVDGVNGYAHFKDILPVELSPEWLNKFSFNKWANGAYHKEAMRTWRVWYDAYEKAAAYCTDVYPELGHAIHLPIRIEFVHQLQNVYFMMTEEELTIKEP